MRSDVLQNTIQEEYTTTGYFRKTKIYDRKLGRQNFDRK